MKRTYINRLPKNVEVKNTNVRIENGKLIVEVEFEEKFEPKDGGFLVSSYGKVFIYSEKPSRDELVYSSYCAVNRIDDIETVFSDNWTKKEGCRFATKQEKSSFLERLEKECHKRWNPETKQLEDIRWRANLGETYWYITETCVFDDKELASSDDDIRYKNNNYFRTREAAQKVADQIKEIFKNSKAELLCVNY